MAEEAVDLVRTLQADYLAYSLSVLKGRAIPDLYDGLKPVQRRVLQTMLEEGLHPSKPYVKCARVTGMTMARLHPHGGAYGALVNMATPWSNQIPWIDGHGNFGSSVDAPAAERYTECRLRPSAIDLLLTDREIWETSPNYDNSRQEAVRFNASIPAVLLNGDTGIAVGFATKLAPHNLGEVVECIKLRRKGKSYKLIPDFPSGCDIVADEQLELYANTGSGGIRCRAKVTESIQKREGRAKDRPMVTFSHFPPGLNPEKLGIQIRDLVEKGRIVDVAEVIDESDLTGDRVTVVGKAACDVGALIRSLYAFTDLDSRYQAKTLVIDGARPVDLSPIQICEIWSRWRLDRLHRRFEYLLDKAEARMHIVEGLIKALLSIDKVIAAIKKAKNKAEAAKALQAAPFRLSAAQADAVLEMRLRQLTNLDKDELAAERELLAKEIENHRRLIDSENEREKYMLAELTKLSKQYSTPRCSQVIKGLAEESVAQAKLPRTPSTPKPRFLKVDKKKGIIDKAPGPRGATLLQPGEKLVVLTESGYAYKLPPTHKGPVAESYVPLIYVSTDQQTENRKFLVLFQLDNVLKGLTLLGSDLVRATRKGKAFIPPSAQLIYCGEDAWSVPWQSSRKKAVKLTVASVKEGKPGGRGVKICNIQELRQSALL